MPGGVYIHIPFCKSRCSYCDFATDVYRDNDTVERYLAALASEISSFELQNSDDKNPDQQPLTTDHPFDTIYFGGGTPSLLSPKQLEHILKAIRTKFSLAKDLEITLEMNPGTVTPEKLTEYKSLGINRASFGVQTFNDRSLTLLARGHDSNDAEQTFDLLREAGFENVSFDLIAGLPNQSLKDWERNLEKAIKMSPEHISLYLLEIHEGTPLAEQISSKRQPMPNEELAAQMYELMLEMLSVSGFLQYEISNFSKPGFESKHNKKYWRCDPVIGFGVSAHSHDGIQTRWSNTADTNAYISSIERGRSPLNERESLSRRQIMGEFMFLGLRLNRGIRFAEFEKRFGSSIQEEYGTNLNRFESLGLIQFYETGIRLTDRGRLYSNEVFSIFV